MFDLSGHVARLAESSGLMQAASTAAATSEDAAACNPEWVDATLRESLRVGLGEWRRLHERSVTPEAKVSVLLAWESAQEPDASADTGPVPPLREALVSDSGAGMYVHVQELKPPSRHPIRVVVRAGPRSNAAAKDTKWVADRAPLEALMSAETGIEEVVLADTSLEGTGLAEGTQTNFAVVTEDGTLQTAGKGVLLGTVRKLLLKACHAESIAVAEITPALAGLLSWQGAVLSSTSRLVMPIDEIRVPEALFRECLGKGADADAILAAGTAPGSDASPQRLFVKDGEVVRRFDNPESGVVRKIEDRVRDMFASMCEPYA